MRKVYIPSLGSIRGELPLCFCFCRRLEELEVRFRVRELLDLLDLQTSVFVGNDISDPHHFADRLHPN